MLVTKDEDEAEKGERAERLIKDICIAQELFQQHHGLSVLRQKFISYSAFMHWLYISFETGAFIIRKFIQIRRN